MELERAMDPCMHCGACFSFCEWDAAVARGESPGPEICRGCQTCYRICPRLPHDAGALATSLLPAAQDTPWGRAMASYTGAAIRPVGDAQDGGVAGALAVELLRSGQVEAVLVTGRDPDWRPQSSWATDEAGVRDAAGSKYTTAPALCVLGDGFDRFRRIAVMALPCQAAALARLAQAKPEFAERLVMVIGLFCSKTFYHGDAESGLTGFLKDQTGLSMREMQRFDIRRGRFIAKSSEAAHEWRIKELSPLAWPICAQCGDLTAEFADIGLGSIGSPEGKNSIVVRSDRAQMLIQDCATAGVLELGELDNPATLEKLSNAKRNSAQQLADEQRKALGRGSMRGNWRRQMRRDA